MPINFTNLVKGQVTQTLIKTLLERTGYRVTRFGIEELFYEVKMIDAQTYKLLGLPSHLRKLPDLLVATPDMSEVLLVEVKYRRRFSDPVAGELHGLIQDQLVAWPGTKAVILIGEPFVEGGRFHQDYIRVIDSENIHMVPPDAEIFPGYPHEWSAEERWGMLKGLHHVFSGFDEAEAVRNADLITRTVRDLVSLT